jgi:WD40 repeat protein
MSRIFMSHQHDDSREAVALKQWLAEQDPPLAHEIFLDLDRDTGIGAGTRWKNELLKAKSRCEAAICLLSKNWAESVECQLEYRNAEDLGKQIFCARLEPSAADGLTRDWHRFDLFGEGEKTEIDIADGSPPVAFRSDALYRLRDGIRGAGITAESFVWPPPGDPQRSPYRGWDPLEERDAGIFYGRDGELVLALDALRDMRKKQYETLFVVLGPSGSGKSSFLRAGILPRLRREDRHYLVLDILRPNRRALSGKTGFANTIFQARRRLRLEQPTLGETKRACMTDSARVRELLTECRQVAAKRIPSADSDMAPPHIVLPIDQAEELFSAEAGSEAADFLRLIAMLGDPDAGVGLGLIVAATIRTDRYEPMQKAPAFAKLHTRLFGELKPMPPHDFREVVTGPARRFSQEIAQLRLEPALVNRLVQDCTTGADTLPMLALMLARLFEDYGSTNEFTLAQYQEMGGIRAVVQNQIDEVLSADHTARTAQLSVLRNAFIPWLASVNPDSDQPMRRIARRSELPEPSLPLIDALIEKRLLIQDERDGDVVVEVALESLLRQWQELTEWLVEERQSLVAAVDLDRAATAWEKNGRDDAWLLAGIRLAGAEAVAAKSGFQDLLASTSEYLTACRRREDDRFHAEQQRQREPIVRQLISEAEKMLTEATEGSDTLAFQLLLAARALQSEPADGPLHDALTARATTLKIIDSGEVVHGVAFSPDGRRLATVGTSAAVQFFDVETGQSMRTPLIGHTNWVNGVAFSADGVRLATAGSDATARLWNADTGEQIGSPLDAHTGAVTSVAFSPGGERFATAGQDATIRLWNAETLQPLGEPFIGHENFVLSVAFSPDGGCLASGSGDHTVRLWDLDTGQPIGGPLAGHTHWVRAVAFSPDGRRLASASDDQTVRIWDAETARLVGEPLTAHTKSVTSVAFSADGRRLASASYDQTVRIWDVETARPVGEPLKGHRKWVTSVVFSPDGRRLASASQDRTVRLWDVERTEEPVGKPLTAHGNWVTCLAFSPDGRHLASGAGSVRLWATDTGQPLTSLTTRHHGWVACVAYQADGRLLASGGTDGVVRLSDTGTGELVSELTGHTGPVTSVAFSPDGRLASASDDATIRVWDVESGETVSELTGHDDSVMSVGFSPDGRRLATAGHDHTVRVWDAHTYEALGHPLTGHAGPVTSVAFSPDGFRLASASRDKTLRLWLGEITPDRLCDKLTANMSRQQWRERVPLDIEYIPACPGLPIPPDDGVVPH